MTCEKDDSTPATSTPPLTGCVEVTADMKVVTNYPLRRPSMDEVRSAFGSMVNALEKTSGDLPLLCFYLNNPQLIFQALPVDRASLGEVLGEMELAAAADAWAAQDGEKSRRTIAEVMRQTGFGRERPAGCWSRLG